MLYKDVVLATPGLIAFWRLNEAAGALKIDDASVNNFIGYANADPGFGGDSPIHANNAGASAALPGDGSASIEIVRTEYLHLNTGWTVEFWYKDDGSGVPTNNLPIIGKPLTASLSKDHWTLGFIPSGAEVKLAVTAGDDPAFTRYLEWDSDDLAAVFDGDWHYYVVKFNRGDVAFYVDGELMGSHLQSNEPSSANQQPEEAFAAYHRCANNGVIHLFGACANDGTWPEASPTFSTTGAFAEVALYDRALTITELKAHYASRNLSS